MNFSGLYITQSTVERREPREEFGLYFVATSQVAISPLVQLQNMSRIKSSWYLTRLLGRLFKYSYAYGKAVSENIMPQKILAGLIGLVNSFQGKPL